MGGATKKITKEAIRPFNPNPKAHDVFGITEHGSPGDPVISPGNNTWPSIYAGGFPSQWGQLSPMPVNNPLAQAQWYTPQQIDASLASGLKGPSALAAGSFMARLAALQGQNGGGNNGA